jgi:hypothetical protein
MPVNSNFKPGQILTAAQLNDQFGAAAAQSDLAATQEGLAQVQDGTATDAGTLTGDESNPVSRGSGLLQTTLTKVAQWVIQTYLGFVQAGAGAVSQTLLASLREHVSAAQFGAVGDSVTNDSAAFALIEAAFTSTPVDLLGKTYLVNSYPPVNRYFNGSFLISGTTYSAPFSGPVRVGNDLILLGTNSGATLPYSYQHPANIFTYTSGVIALGTACMKNMTAVQNSTAIGFSAMANGTISFDNTAIGEAALQNVSSTSAVYSSTVLTGTRNVAIGGNAGQFLTTGNQNTFIGRNTGTTCVSVVGATAIGAGALFGWQATGGWDASIQNWWPNTTSTPNALTAVGAGAANRYTGVNITAIGGGAGTNLTRATNCTMIGLSAGLNLESPLLPNGHTQVIPGGGSFSATYTVASGLITVTYAGHSAVAGQLVGFSIPNGPTPTNGAHPIYSTVVSVIDANTFTINTPLAGTGSGTFIVYTFDTGVAGTSCTQNTFIGANAGHGATQATTANTFVGFNAGSVADSSVNNAILGGSAGTLSTTMTSSTLLGANAGSFSGNGSATLTQCTFVGAATGYQYIGGTVPASYTNVSILGYGALVSGDNQVQLGNSSTTTYVYGTVQNRSDLNDKADIEDSTLDEDWFMDLRAVQGRWDMRDDYIEHRQTGVDADGNPIYETIVLPKDGSKKRKRLHQWFIAQEVDATSKKHGVEFGGYQDHSINGGPDVKSLGYDEFIPPTVARVQDHVLRLRALEKQVAELLQAKADQDALTADLKKRITAIENPSAKA